jgi:hypothetical protein
MTFWPHDILCCLFAAFLLPSLKEPLSVALSRCMTFCAAFCAAFLKGPLLGALSSCMTFLDLTEGDKLAFLVVELHVGRGDSVMRSGIKIRYLAHAHISWFW